MLSHDGQAPISPEVAEMQDALFMLRDSLMNLKMSLLDLAAFSDEGTQQFAQDETSKLLARLRA